MKLFVKLMFAALFIAMLLPFTFLKDQDGDTLLSVSDFSLPDFSMPDLPDMPELPNMADKKTRPKSTERVYKERDIFYQWYDGKGNVQFTTQPPDEGIPYTIKDYDPDTNVIPSVDVEVEAPKPAEVPPIENSGDKSAPASSLYSKEGIEKLFDDANDLENLLNKRLQNQESALNQ